MIDAHEVLPGLWQGSVPPQGKALRHAGFSMLVLCAAEHQPDDDVFPGVEVVHTPFEDIAFLVQDQALLKHVRPTVRRVAAAVLGGQKVLVTCAAGINRSGLVTALSMRRLTGWPGRLCIQRLRETRHPNALFNPQFQRIVLTA